MTLLWIRNSSVSASVPNVDFVLKVAIMFTQENGTISELTFNSKFFYFVC